MPTKPEELTFSVSLLSLVGLSKSIFQDGGRYVEDLERVLLAKHSKACEGARPEERRCGSFHGTDDPSCVPLSDVSDERLHIIAGSILAPLARRSDRIGREAAQALADISEHFSSRLTPAEDEEDFDGWWVDHEERLPTGYGNLVAIRDVNRLVVGFARPEDAERIVRGGA